VPASTLAEWLARIEEFLLSCREPVLLEAGEEPLPLLAGSYAVEARGDRLIIQAWDDTRNLTRRVTALGPDTPGRIELAVERFGKRPGTVILLDRARASSQRIEARAARSVFREQFRLFLRRQYPQWNIAELTSAADLEHSLSPSYPRALLKKGSTAWAAIASPHGASVDGVLGFGLVWLDYLRRRESRVLLEGLALFLPAGEERVTCLRLQCLNPRAARFAVFLYDENQWEHQVDPILHGNLETHLDPASHHRGARHDPFQPEAILELTVRRQLPNLDAQLLPAPVYGQVPAFAGGDRGVLDLLACEHSGRLAVIELKATADLQLPMQALDYWMRVRWHTQRGDFTELGYFPNRALVPDPPRLLLVAPALEFHSTSETLLRYYCPDIQVERIGLGVEWQSDVAVMFRLSGAQSPR
jgi:hypothetical protein